MQKNIYVLSHSYVIEGTIDIYETKHIGVFSTYDKACDIINELKDVIGFRDHTNGFRIEEQKVFIDQYKKHFQEPLKYVFRLTHESYVKDSDYNLVTYFGFYVSLQEAEEKLEKIKAVRKYANTAQGFCIDKCKIDSIDWSEGFNR